MTTPSCFLDLAKARRAPQLDFPDTIRAAKKKMRLCIFAKMPCTAAVQPEDQQRGLIPGFEAESPHVWGPGRLNIAKLHHVMKR